tara:strand:- start:233 stop:1201 length:969 start_codon:yes stop_codon:yes gene_type:complete
MLLNILVFMIVLLVYLHVFYHLKVSNDLEVYEHDITNKNNLEEILNLRQPVVMNYNKQNLDELFTIDNIYKTYSKYEVNVRKNNMDNELVDKNITVSIDLLKNLFENENKYYSENNETFIKKANFINKFQENDFILKPPMTSEINYDILLGGKNTSTKFKYDVNFRHFLYASYGNMNVTLSPPINTKNMELYKDYYNFEYISSINPYLKEDEMKMKSISKISITLKKGQLLFIPAYWWYSIQFNNSVILIFKYKTYMNQLTILPEYIMSFMQRQNIKKKNQNKIYKAEPSLKKEVKEEKKEKKNKKIKKIKKNDRKEDENNI